MEAVAAIEAMEMAAVVLQWTDTNAIAGGVPIGVEAGCIAPVFMALTAAVGMVR